MNKNDCLQIGNIIKTRGVNGELILEAKDSIILNNIKESVLVELDGLLVPFFINDFQTVSSTRIRVLFDWIESEPQAKKLVSCEVYLPLTQIKAEKDDFKASPALLEGFRVIDDNHGEIGFISEYIDNSSNPLLIITNNKTEIIVPFQEDIILEIDADNKTLFINTPEGLIDLYLQ